MPIIGIVAAQSLTGDAGEDEGIPVVGPTLIDFDFLSDIYEVNGSPTTAAAIITTPGDIDAGGLELAAFGTPNIILGDASDILCGESSAGGVAWTLAMEFQVSAVTGSNHPMFCIAETPTGAGRDIFECGSFSSTQWQAFDDNSEVSSRVVNGGIKTTGIHKMSVTRTDQRIAICVDGGEPFVADSYDVVLDEIDVATFGGPAESSNGSVETHIRTFKVYQEQDDDILQLLSV